MRSSWPADRLVGWLLPILAILAEGAWLTVVYVAVETTIDGRVPILGTFELAAAAGLAALAVRRGLLHPDDNPLTFFAALIGFGAVGLAVGRPGAVAPARRRPRRRDRPAPRRLAADRGRHARRRARGRDRRSRADPPRPARRARCWRSRGCSGQLGAGELRPVFVEHAFVASLTFISAGFMAAGLARLQEIGRETGVDWRTSRSWLGTVLGVLAIVLAIGVPAAYMLGLPVEAVTRGLIGPVFSLLGYLLLAHRLRGRPSCPRHSTRR